LQLIDAFSCWPEIVIWPRQVYLLETYSISREIIHLPFLFSRNLIWLLLLLLLLIANGFELQI